MTAIIDRLTKRRGMINSKKAVLPIVICAVVGLGLFSAITILPYVGAQQNNGVVYNDIPSAIKGKSATLLEQANQAVKQKINGHPSWIGIVSLSGGKVTIDYVGPAAGNPYQHKPWNHANSIVS